MDEETPPLLLIPKLVPGSVFITEYTLFGDGFGNGCGDGYVGLFNSEYYSTDGDGRGDGHGYGGQR